MKSHTIPPRLFLFIVLLVLTGFISFTQETTPEAAEPQTTIEIREQIQKELKVADDELNKVYKELMADLDEIGKEKLRMAQRAWIKFRDTNADYMADAARGGTLAGILHGNTLLEMTKERTEELKGSNSLE